MANLYQVSFITEKTEGELLTEIFNTGKFDMLGEDIFIYGGLEIIGKYESGEGELKIIK